MSIKTAKKKKRKRIEDSWSIDYAFAEWIVPRLDLLIKRDYGHPMSFREHPEKWMEVLNQMRDGFEIYVKSDKKISVITEDEMAQVDQSLELFKKYFYNLWD